MKLYVTEFRKVALCGILVNLLRTVNIKGRMDVPAFIFGLLASTVELMELGM